MKRDGPPPSGLSTSSKHSVEVVFHALFPLDVWGELVEGFHVHIRFGSHSLGDWEYDCGEFKFEKCRYVLSNEL